MTSEAAAASAAARDPGDHDAAIRVITMPRNTQGKSTLAKHLGLAALARGHSVRFTILAAALADLLRRDSVPAVERRLRRYTNCELLMVDELGYVPCDSDAADLLFRIVSKRHESRAVVITTNLAYKQWGTVFGDAPCLGALL